MSDFVTLAILAKDKAHTLPLYLACIDALDWPKNRIHLYVRTNNNNDATARILREWLDRTGSLYASIFFDDSSVATNVQQFGQHEWNGARFDVLANIRQASVDWARKNGSHYFVVDCDNFIHPDTLTEIARTGLPIVAPLLHSQTAYSNYHANIDANGYYAESEFYHALLQRRLRGLIELPVVHCTYFIRNEWLEHIRYSDGSGRHEYVIFSDNARKHGIPQYLDTRRVYGRLTFAENADALAAEPWIAEFPNYARPGSKIAALPVDIQSPPTEGVPAPVTVEPHQRTAGKPRICLSMIVKNEAPVIERCLRSVKPFVHAWAISDTGSTDGTQDIIRKFMADLPGELIERPWVDFSTNRNQALELARQYGDYALIIDADDELEAEPGFAWPPLDACGYCLEIVDRGNVRYWRVALPRSDAGWEWRGVLHEALCSAAPAQPPKLPGLRILRLHNDGARSRQSQVEKFTRDAQVLRAALEKEPGNARYRFYLAQSLRDAGDLAGAIAEYEKRAAMGGWQEEVYFSKLQVALLKERSGAPYPDVVAAYLDACDCRPARAEAPCELARWFRLHQRWNLAHHFAQIAVSLPIPDDALFIDRAVHDWRARDELSIAAYWCGDYAQSAALCRELLAGPHLPAGERVRVEKNLSFAVAPPAAPTSHT